MEALTPDPRGARAATSGSRSGSWTATGGWHELDIAIANLLDDPKRGGLAVTGCDVTEGHFNQITRRLENQLLQLLPTAITVTDERGVVVYWNDRATTTVRLLPAEAGGPTHRRPQDRPEGRRRGHVLSSQVRSSGRWEGDYETVRSDGSTVPIHMTLERVAVEEIGFHGMVGASVDISERRQLEENLAFQALHDPLTGLPNRRLFVHHLDNSLSRASVGRQSAPPCCSSTSTTSRRSTTGSATWPATTSSAGSAH